MVNTNKSKLIQLSHCLKIIFIFAFMFSFFHTNNLAFASDSIKDLENKVKSESNPEVKIELLISLSEKYQSNEPDKSLQYSQEALSLAKSNKLLEKQIDSLNAVAMGYIGKYEFETANTTLDEAISLNTNKYYKGLGYSHLGKSVIDIENQSYESAISNLKIAEINFEQANYPQGLAYLYANYAYVYQSYENFEKALDFNLKALKLNEEIGNKEEIAASQNNIALIYSAMSDYEKALDYAFKSMKLNEEIGNTQGLGTSLNTSANLVLEHFENYDLALDLFLKAVTVNEEIGNKTEVANALNNIGVTLTKLENYKDAIEYYVQALNLRYELNDTEGIVNSYNNIGVAYYYLNDIENAISYHSDALSLAKENSYKEGLRSSLLNLSNDYAGIEEFKSAYDFFRLYSTIKDQIFNEDYLSSISKMQTVYETEKKEQENVILKTTNELLEKDKFIQRIIIGLTFLILSIVSVLGFVIAKEKKKSEKLLLNILPVRVAQDLKATGKTEPEVFESVTVYFSDIVGFTSTSSNLEPKFLINELSDIFTRFDSIMTKYNCERIKTIGDAYMAVGNLTIPNENHAESLLLAADEILTFLHERNTNNEIQWRIRIGLHSGKLVGGVVGTSKYIYDVFGDTVNTASRMESNSEPMRINVSDKTYDILKDKFNFLPREPIEVKGKGLFYMYFYEGKLPEEAV